MRYKIKYGKWWFQKTIEVTGHKLDAANNRMDFFLPDSKGIISIANWHNYNVELGRDFIIAQKEQAEKESGQSINLERN